MTKPILCQRVCVSVAAAIALAPCVSGAAAGLPARHAQAIESYLAAWESLPLIQRSDWLNVKTDLTPKAVGDGVADDTAALQKACAMFDDRKPYPRVLYFPPGTYRITDTLVLTKIQGGALYGHGGATRIVWDGPKGQRMLHSNGFGRCLHYGISWDGRNRAAVGVDHDSKTCYETRVRYQYCRFRNFTDSGIRVGHEQKLASAEMMYMDCLFENCRRGVSFLQFNDYDNAVIRCVFRHCGSAVHCYRGNVYVRDCHFENSREQDVLLPPHSHSIRRCTSVGSNAFVRWAQKGAHSFLLAVQDCYVARWKDPTGAMQLDNRGPTLVFDSVFADPAAPDSPAVNLVNDRPWEQTLIAANVKAVNLGAKPIQPGVRGRVIRVPRAGRGFLILEHASKRWRHRPALPTKVFDAKRDFGAAGDGRADDTAAIQKTIHAARTHGSRAMAYLPVGTYRVSRPLEVKGGDYVFGGALAFRTILTWAGKAGRPIVHAHSADGVRIEQLLFRAPKEMACTSLLVTSDGPGRFVCDGVFVGGAWQPKFRGLVLKNLPAGFAVHAPHVDGDTRIEGCGHARILIDNWYAGYAGPLNIAGQTGAEGFLGINSAVSSHCEFDITVSGNASIVVGDYYTEQTSRHLLATGKPGQTPGRVTISNAKVHGKHEDRARIRGYSGQITLSRANMVYSHTRFTGTGGKRCGLLLLGNTFNPDAPDYRLRGIRLYRVGCTVWNYKDRTLNQPLPDTPDRAGAIKAVNAALDHFRELSLANLVEF